MCAFACVITLAIWHNSSYNIHTVPRGSLFYRQKQWRRDNCSSSVTPCHTSDWKHFYTTHNETHFITLWTRALTRTHDTPALLSVMNSVVAVLFVRDLGHAALKRSLAVFGLFTRAKEAISLCCVECGVHRRRHRGGEKEMRITLILSIS